MDSKNIGKVVQIVGAVVDIRFEKDHLPDLLNAVEIELNGQKLTVEVAQHRRQRSQMYRYVLNRRPCKRHRGC